MNIALIGYGRMGHEIESIAVSRGHLIKVIIDQDNTGDLNETVFKGVDVAIEFSFPGAAFDNIVKCLRMKVPVAALLESPCLMLLVLRKKRLKIGKKP